MYTQEECTPLHAGGDLSPLWGSRGANAPQLGGPRANDPLAGIRAIDVKLPCKSLVISSQSGPFIRWMI